MYVATAMSKGTVRKASSERSFMYVLARKAGQRGQGDEPWSEKVRWKVAGRVSIQPVHLISSEVPLWILPQFQSVWLAADDS